MMLENIEMLLEHRSLSVNGIFEYLQKSKNFTNLKFIDNFIEDISKEIDYENALENSFAKQEKLSFFDKEDLELLKGYFSVMGKTDLKGQISNCRLYKDFFRQKLQRLESEESMKCKSTGTFIVGAGVLVIIVLI